MLRNTWLKKEFCDKVVDTITGFLGERVLAVILFGSGRDIDLLVVVKDRIRIKEKLGIEYRITSILHKKFRDLEFDVHIFDYEAFLENLIPNSFLAGLALGYIVLLDKYGIEEKILEFLKRLSREKRVLINRYGEWNLSHYARITLNLKEKQYRG
mgnify:CR=1 FL=1